MTQVDRRAFIAGSVAALAGVATTGGAAESTAVRRGNRIAVATYSFWRFKEGLKMPIEQCIDEAARMGFDAVDILLRQIEGEENVDNVYLQKLKRHALINGLEIPQADKDRLLAMTPGSYTGKAAELARRV